MIKLAAALVMAILASVFAPFAEATNLVGRLGTPNSLACSAANDFVFYDNAFGQKIPFGVSNAPGSSVKLHDLEGYFTKATAGAAIPFTLYEMSTTSPLRQILITSYVMADAKGFASIQIHNVGDIEFTVFPGVLCLEANPPRGTNLQGAFTMH